MFFLSANGGGTRVAVIEGGSKTVAEYDLGRNRVYEVTSSNGHILTIEVKDGGVSVISSTCDNGHCVGFGEIKHTGETIVCAPAKIKIKIVSEEGEQNDFVVG
ncbi:MAG: NusG domain II-containing protein [Clostridia bacterium]|nr:NusG domain II-containing protein [Clostridia bacterium]